jgi:uncharacterized protein YndB with AHSA1/START domain
VAILKVALPVSCDVAFDYLADPHHRPKWQSSLARVVDVDGEVRVGQTWTDVTRPGMRPAMETTELDRPHRWTETGTWRGFSATLTLTFTETPTGCDVEPTMTVRGRGLRAPFGAVLDVLAPYAVRSDLRHAASMLTA